MKANLTYVFTYPNEADAKEIEAGKLTAATFREVGESFEAVIKDWPKGAELIRKEWESYAWPGAYPLYYITKDSGCLCPACANKNLELTLGDDPQWQIVAVDVNYEDVTYCDNCDLTIPRAYGDEDDDN